MEYWWGANESDGNGGQLTILKEPDINPGIFLSFSLISGFGVPLRSQTGMWNDQKRATKPNLPSYLRHNVSYHFSRALSWLRLSSHILDIERLRLKQHRVPHELRVCNKCNWHRVQDGEHALLDCLSADLANLRVKHHHFFCNPSSSTNRLRDFIRQADTKGLALYVLECLKCCA